MQLRQLPRERAVWLFAVAVLLLFWQPLTIHTFYFRDLYLLFYPMKAFLAENLREGTIPLWDHLTNGGRPFAATPSNYVFHPSNLLFVLLPVIDAFNLVIVLHVFACAVAAYWLARTLGMTEWPAFIAGAVFAFCGYTLSTANLTPILLGLPWVPLTLGLVHRRSYAAAAVTIAMPLIGAAAELTAMSCITLIVLRLAAARESWRSARSSPDPSAVQSARAGIRRDLTATALAIVIAAGLSLIQTLPAANVLRQSSRAGNVSYEMFSAWSVHPQRLPELVAPGYFGDLDSLREESYWGRAYETLGFPYILSIYVGIPVLVLAAFGARRSPVLACLAAAGLLLSLGRYLPGFQLIHEYVPLVGIFRYPVKAQIISLLPLSLLAAYGADTIGTRRWVLALAAVAGALAFTNLAFLHAAVAAAAFALVPRGAWLAGVVIIDLLVAGYRVNDYAPRAIYEKPPLAEKVRAAIGTGRFYSAEREVVIDAPTDDLMWLARWNIATLNDYSATMSGIPTIFHTDYDDLAPRRIGFLSRVMRRIPWEQRKLVLDRAGVTAFIAQRQLPAFTQLAEMRAPTEPLRLYANPGGRMAWFTSSAALATSGQDALNRLLTSPATILEKPVPLGNCGEAAVAKQGDTYTVDAPCAGVVVLAEPYYDGWSAVVDGREVAHIRANFAFSAVPVSAGRHTIVRTYRQPLLVEGIIGSLLSALAVAGLYVWGRRFRVEAQ